MEAHRRVVADDISRHAKLHRIRRGLLDVCDRNGHVTVSPEVPMFQHEMRDRPRGRCPPVRSSKTPPLAGELAIRTATLAELHFGVLVTNDPGYGLTHTEAAALLGIKRSSSSNTATSSRCAPSASRYWRSVDTRTSSEASSLEIAPWVTSSRPASWAWLVRSWRRRHAQAPDRRRHPSGHRPIRRRRGRRSPGSTSQLRPAGGRHGAA